MISYDLSCASGHSFEGWFGSSIDFDNQQCRGLIACPVCSDVRIAKMPMAPSIGRKGNQGAVQATVPAQNPASLPATTPGPLFIPAPMAQMIEQLATMQTELLKNSHWVGNSFAEEARAIHYGESEERSIHGEASADEAEALAEEGVKIGALPFPVVPGSAKN